MPEKTSKTFTRRPAAAVLIAAAAYNLAWGAWVVLRPGDYFHLVGLDPPAYPAIWQCVGMIVAVFGIGYAIAASDPRRHWPIVLVGFLGKVFGPVGYVEAALIAGSLDPRFGWTLITNDLIWWVPFALILLDAWRHRGGVRSGVTTSARERAPAKLGAGEAGEGDDDLRAVLGTTRTQRGDTLAALSEAGPVLVVLLRHLGCIFCREMLADLGRQREAIEHAGERIVIVAQSPADRLAPMLPRYGLEGVDVVSDPQRRLYRALDLPRGRLGQLFGPRVWWRGLIATLRGHRVGRLEGDGFQMPGAFVIERGRVVRGARPATAGDRIDFAQLAGCGCGDTGHEGEGACGLPAEPVHGR